MAWTIPTVPSAQPFDIPFIGGDLAKIGRAIDLYSTPCSPSAEIWVYGFFQAIPTLFISLLKPQLIDINIRHRHGRPRKGKRLKFIAQAVFRDAIIEIPVPRWVPFRIYEWAQRVGWYLLVADATEQFAINWMSLAYKYDGCVHVPNAWTHRANVHQLQGVTNTQAGSSCLNGSDSFLNFTFPANVPAPTIDGPFRISWKTMFEPYAIPAQSGLPVATYLAVGGVVQKDNLVWGPDFQKRYSSGSMVVDVLNAPRPTLGLRVRGTQPNKFCYVTGQYHIDRIGLDNLESDP
jgi:hypothetical protein